MAEPDHNALFLTWLDEHGSAVMKVARAYTLTSEDSQDLAQEILLQAWRSLPNFEGRANVATWFYRVALHTAMNWKRKDRPRRTSQQPLLEIHAVATPDSDGTLGGLCRQAEPGRFSRLVINAIQSLDRVAAERLRRHAARRRDPVVHPHHPPGPKRARRRVLGG